MKKLAWTLTLLTALPMALSAEVTKEDLKKLIGAGISDEVILSYIKSNGPVAKLSADDVIELKQAGASEKILSVVVGNTPPPSPAPRSSATVSPGYSPSYSPEYSTTTYVEPYYYPSSYYSSAYYGSYYPTVYAGFYPYYSYYCARPYYYGGYCGAYYGGYHGYCGTSPIHFSSGVRVSRPVAHSTVVRR